MTTAPTPDNSVLVLPMAFGLQLLLGRLRPSRPGSASSACPWYNSRLSGQLPAVLGSWAEFNCIGVSTNFLTSMILPYMCRRGTMAKLLILGNNFSGEIPASYANCSSLIQLMAGGNSLSDVVPAGIWNLPRDGKDEAGKELGTAGSSRGRLGKELGGSREEAQPGVTGTAEGRRLARPRGRQPVASTAGVVVARGRRGLHYKVGRYSIGTPLPVEPVGGIDGTIKWGGVASEPLSLCEAVTGLCLLFVYSIL